MSVVPTAYTAGGRLAGRRGSLWRAGLLRISLCGPLKVDPNLLVSSDRSDYGDERLIDIDALLRGSLNTLSVEPLRQVSAL